VGIGGSSGGMAAALQAAAGQAFDLVVSDIAMPGMDGLQLAAALRRRPRSAHWPASVDGEPRRVRHVVDLACNSASLCGAICASAWRLERRQARYRPLRLIPRMIPGGPRISRNRALRAALRAGFDGQLTKPVDREPVHGLQAEEDALGGAAIPSKPGQNLSREQGLAGIFLCPLRRETPKLITAIGLGPAAGPLGITVPCTHARAPAACRQRGWFAL
jgi:CheY-like chemotaxis protein